MAVEKDKSMSMSELQDLIVYYKDNLTEEYIQIDRDRFKFCVNVKN